LVEQSAQNQQLIIEDITDVPKEVLRWSTVSLTEVSENQNRLEASVFEIEGKHAREVIKNCKWDLKTICGESGFATAYHRPRFKRIWVENSELPIYQPSQITELNPIPSGYISEITNTDIESLRVKKGQILLTCSGTIGNTTVVNNTLDNKIFSHDLIRIDCHDEVNIGYLYAFLRTKLGKTLINTNSYGSVISHIEPEHLNNIAIPNPSVIIKKQVHDLITKSFDLRDESNNLFTEAEELLIEELELPKINELSPKYLNDKLETRVFSSKLSELDTRLEGSYHLPIVEEIHEQLDKSAERTILLGDKEVSKEVILPGRFKRQYVDEGQGIVFFGGKQLYELDPSNKKYLSPTFHKDRIENELKLKENMILITCSGTIGKTTLVPKHWENWTSNQHIIRVVPSSKSIAGYLYTFLASAYGYELITRSTYGSVVDEINNDHIARVKVPLLKNKDKQKYINDISLQANSKRYKAYKLEQEAIQLVYDKVFNRI